MGPTAEIARGSVLGGRYRLERRIAGGGMATVWLGEDTSLGRPVAVKVLSDVLAADHSYRARFRREARLAAGLSHPNLVRVFDFGDGRRPFLVMEYVPGPPLAQRIADGEPVGGERLARELLTALAHIHRAGVVHRDVKPANVLIGRGGAMKLTDFGIARPDDATRITETGNVVGTLRYMAPEVARGAPATERADLYSAGVVLAEAAGERPPPRLGALIDSLRAREPGDRPRSADASLALLEGGEPTTPTTPLRDRRRLEVPLWAILAGLVAVGLVVLAIALAAGGGGNAGGSARAGSGAGHAGGAPSGPRTATSSPSPGGGAAATPAAGGGQAPGGGATTPAGSVPPGLAKKGGEPPGLAKKGGVPPGQAGKGVGDEGGGD